MMRLRAVVRKLTGKVMHLQGPRTAGGLEVDTLPEPSTVEIAEQDGAVFLLRLDDAGECIADTWHESVDAAKEQANYEYGVEIGDWEDLELQN